MKKLGTSVVFLAFLISALGGTAAEAGGGATTTCTSGSVAAGTYTNLLIKGDCRIASGAVTVNQNVEVAPGASLNAGIGGTGSNTLRVTGNIDVEENAILVLGCDSGFSCGTPTHDIVEGSITAHQALSVILHNDDIGGSVTINGGGGGANCYLNPHLTGVFGFPTPAFDVVQDSLVGGASGGDLSVTNVNTCWEGIIYNGVVGNVTIRANHFADFDANDVQQNYIGKNLSCSGNTPAPDDDGYPNTGTGFKSGQCVGL